MATFTLKKCQCCFLVPQYSLCIYTVTQFSLKAVNYDFMVVVEKSAHAVHEVVN